MSAFKKQTTNQRRQSMPVSSCSLDNGRRKSLLQNIFRTGHRHSLPDIDKRDAPQQISLRNLEEGHIYSTLKCERARVWRVRHRNSISESIGRDLDLKPLLETPTSNNDDPESVVLKLRDDHVFYTCYYKFDIIGLFQDYIMYQSVEASSNTDGRNLILKSVDGSYDSVDSIDERNNFRMRSDSFTYLKGSQVNQGSPFTSSRPSLNMMSNKASPICCRRDNTENINTSYWDLCIPDKEDDNTTGPRRNSWSHGMATLPKSRALKKVNGIRTLDRSNIGVDNIKKQCSCPYCFERASQSTKTLLPPDKINRRMISSSSRKRSRSETCERMIKNDEVNMMQRSRSVDCSNRSRNLRRSRRISSLVRHIPFSDIEASDGSDVEPLRSGESSRRDSRCSSSSLDLHSSSSECKDRGYQNTDHIDKTGTSERMDNAKITPSECNTDAVVDQEDMIHADNPTVSQIELKNDSSKAEAINTNNQSSCDSKHVVDKDIQISEKQDTHIDKVNPEHFNSIESQHISTFDKPENDESKMNANYEKSAEKCTNKEDNFIILEKIRAYNEMHEGTSVDCEYPNAPCEFDFNIDTTGTSVDCKYSTAPLNVVFDKDATDKGLNMVNGHWKGKTPDFKGDNTNFKQDYDEVADTNNTTPIEVGKIYETDALDSKLINMDNEEAIDKGIKDNTEKSDTKDESTKLNITLDYDEQMMTTIEDETNVEHQTNKTQDDGNTDVVDTPEEAIVVSESICLERDKSNQQTTAPIQLDGQTDDHIDGNIEEDKNVLDHIHDNVKLNDSFDLGIIEPLENEISNLQESKRRQHRALSLPSCDINMGWNCNTMPRDLCRRNKLEFKSMSVEDLLFCSGRSKSLTGESDDVKDVFEAITTETEKLENKDKDMMVIFLVGGELKVLRRSGASGHGDRIRADLPSMTRQDFPQSNGNHDHVVSSSHPSDYKRPRPKSEIIIGRSQSFAGMADQSPQRKAAPGAMVLGESFRHHRGATMPTQKPSPAVKGASSVSFRKSPKVPKVPRPNRALLMFQSVKKGIREFIEATKEDIEDLQTRDLDGTSTAQGRLHETDKQLKSAERYLKRLEFHLSKLDELHEYYMVQQQLREGVRTMHKAYVTSPGKQRHTLSNVKYGYKECTQTMCNIEAQLESMMGTFNCKLKGIAGFARLCPGDVFEVTTRHGTQKWKTKGRIEKSGHQKWDIPEYNFKAIVGDIINIKGVEVRAFKSILLGQKSCETKDLFSSNPQLMTVSINVNGSLKLSIVITWNPLDGVDESMAFMETPMRPQGTPRRRPVSVIAINGHQISSAEDQYEYERRHSNPPSMQQTKSRDDNFILRSNISTPHINNISSYHGLDSPHAGARMSDNLPEAYRQTQLGPLYSQSVGSIPMGYGGSSPALFRDTDSNPQPINQSSVYSSALPPVVTSHLHFPSVSLQRLSGSLAVDSSVSNIEDVVHNLTSALEDYHGQYTELNKLEELVKLAHKLMRRQLRHNSRASSISVSIEDALEAFDFLDTEEITEEPQSPAMNNAKSSYEDMLCSPESTAKTGDSGIESLAERLSEDTQLESSHGSSPVPPSLGNEEVDHCLMYHLTYCERLLENLGAFGPLKCREIYALDKIQKQSTIVESLLKLAKSGSQVDLHNVMSSLCVNKGLREFWVKCTDQNSLFVSPDRLALCLEQKYASVISEKYGMDPAKVCQHVITRVLDIPDYEAEQGRPYFVITLHQFMLYFNEEGGLNHVEKVAEELKLVEKLLSGNSDMVIKAILTLRDSIPTAPCLKVIGMLLVTLDKEVEQCTISYLSLIQKKKENRDRAMIVFVEGLEDRTSEIRAGACTALAILEATESIDQLVYLWQSDSSPLVQNKAKEALQSMGDEGKRAFDEAQLSKHGFQGIQVKQSTFI